MKLWAVSAQIVVLGNDGYTSSQQIHSFILGGPGFQNEKEAAKIVAGIVNPLNDPRIEVHAYVVPWTELP